MSIIDFILAFVVIIFIATDLKRGGLRQISNFLGFFISLFCFFMLYFAFRKINVVDSTFFFTVGVVVPVLFYGFIKINLDYRFDKKIKSLPFKLADKMCGGFTGLVKGLFMVVLMVSLTASMPKWLGWHHRFINYALKESVFYRATFPYNPAVYLKLYLFFRQNINQASDYKDEAIKDFLSSKDLQNLVRTKNFIMFCHHPKTNEIKEDMDILQKIYSAVPIKNNK